MLTVLWTSTPKTEWKENDECLFRIFFSRCFHRRAHPNGKRNGKTVWQWEKFDFFGYIEAPERTPQFVDNSFLSIVASNEWFRLPTKSLFKIKFFWGVFFLLLSFDHTITCQVDFSLHSGIREMKKNLNGTFFSHFHLGWITSSCTKAKKKL